MGEPAFGARAPQAAAPLEQPGDGPQRGAGRPTDAQPARGPDGPGLRSSLHQDPSLEDR